MSANVSRGHTLTVFLAFLLFFLAFVDFIGRIRHSIDSNPLAQIGFLAVFTLLLVLLVARKNWARIVCAVLSFLAMIAFLLLLLAHFDMVSHDQKIYTFLMDIFAAPYLLGEQVAVITYTISSFVAFVLLAFSRDIKEYMW